MNGRIGTGIALLATLGTAACASMRVGSDYDREASFAAATYDWVDAPDEAREDVDRINPFIDRRMRRAVDDELAAKGLVRAVEGPVDLLVSVSVLDADRAAPERGYGVSPLFLVGLGFGYAPGIWGPWGWGYSPFYPGWDYGPGWGYGPRRYRGFGSVGFGVGVSPYFGVPYGYGAYGPYGYYGGGRGRDLKLAPGSFIVDVMEGGTGELVWRGWAEGALAYAPDEEDLPAFIASVVHRIMERFPPPGRPAS